MTDDKKRRGHERWAHLRFSIIGPLLAAPPAKGELREAIAALSQKAWRHPFRDELIHFGASTIERWYYAARANDDDPVTALRRRIRKDLGEQWALSGHLKAALIEQYGAHKSWSYQLHADNLAALVKVDPKIGPMPSYSTIVRFMKTTGLVKRRRLRAGERRNQERAEARAVTREIRSYEAEYVNGLWHLDFHQGSKKVLTSRGEWRTPFILGILDDRSRLACHAQWYLAESAENLTHGLSQAIQKRGLPRALLTDNGSAMLAAETTQGLARLGILHETTLAYSPYQNGKQESFWGPVEGRLIAMLEGVTELSIPVLNEATQAWIEMEYNRNVHSEIKTSPSQRFLADPSVGRESPSSANLRLAFMAQTTRTQRKSDGTISIEGTRFEIPTRFRHLDRVTVRYAFWDLSYVVLVDPLTGSRVGRIYPLDREKNGDGQRRLVASPSSSPPVAVPEPGVAPLLKQLLNAYAATGLPPAYLPKKEEDRG